MLRKIINLLYITTLLIAIICLPLSAIFVVCKLCAATSMSWFGCCLPLIITLAIAPVLIISKFLIDTRGGK